MISPPPCYPPVGEKAHSTFPSTFPNGVSMARPPYDAARRSLARQLYYVQTSRCCLRAPVRPADANWRRAIRPEQAISLTALVWPWKLRTGPPGFIACCPREPEGVNTGRRPAQSRSQRLSHMDVLPKQTCLSIPPGVGISYPRRLALRTSQSTTVIAATVSPARTSARQAGRRNDTHYCCRKAGRTRHGWVRCAASGKRITMSG